MLQTFTKDEQLREQYRLQEEFVRAQRTERALLKKEREEKEIALKAKEREKKAKEKEKKAKEAALKEKERLKENSIHFMKQQGCTPEQIAEILEIPLNEVPKK